MEKKTAPQRQTHATQWSQAAPQTLRTERESNWCTLFFRLWARCFYTIQTKPLHACFLARLVFLPFRPLLPFLPFLGHLKTN